MSECFRYVFIKNEKSKDSKDFKDEIFLHGIALYEVIRIVSGKALFLESHLERLNKSASKLEQNIWLNSNQIKEGVAKLIALNDTKEGNIKLVFHIENRNKTFYAYFVKHYYPQKEQYENGVLTLVHPAERPIPNAKVYNHQLRSKTNDIIKDAEIFEVLLLNSMGNITEGSRSNLFLIKNNELHTSLDTSVLEGIIRSKVLEIAKKLNIPIRKHSLPFNHLSDYESAFLTGTSLRILPIRKINSIAYSCSNPLLKKLSNCLQNEIENYLQ
ncbi:aminotransferase class IV [Labilibaculum sp.]|uniref:aminotransferase class IV n=1 Tax=Labilibaculum sp. TaxID=2060723 RepID=UPI0035633452